MITKDDIFRSFLTNELLESKYKIKKEELPKTLNEGLNCKEPIIKAIALIISGLEKSPSATDNELRTSIIQFLNTAI